MGEAHQSGFEICWKGRSHFEEGAGWGKRTWLGQGLSADGDTLAGLEAAALEIRKLDVQERWWGGGGGQGTQMDGQQIQLKINILGILHLDG